MRTLPGRYLVAALTVLCALLLAPAAAGAAAPENGFVVFKDLRTRAVVEARGENGQFLWQEALGGRASSPYASCLDPRHRFFGPRWRRQAPSFLVNVESLPEELDAGEALADLLAGNRAWQSPFVTDCPLVFLASSYRSTYAGETSAPASLADLVTDGLNVLEFRSLAGTICDGAVACTIIEYERGRINEADLVFEPDLGRYGFDDHWTTDDTTAVGPTSGLFALIDVATHEFGHFAGLDHVERSPSLTMFPLIHDGMQTLGLGDMKGLRILY